jgi:hypothetical protein
LDADLAHPENIPVKDADSGAAYLPEFSGHVIGGSFLNSPHARATATIVPNSLGKYDISTATYNSNFKGYTCWQSSSSTSPAKTMLVGGVTHEIKNKTDCETLYGAGAWRPDTKGSCVTCHDVHQSMFVAGQEGLRKECVSCHDNSDYAAAVAGTAQASIINHPTTTFTPAGIDPADPCVVCHMPKATSGGFPMHVWRINSDAAYSTFPTGTEFGAFPGTTATKKNANTAADGAYANAVWVDIDLACGQCHGGSAGPGATKNAPYWSKASLAVWAKNMHTPAPTYVPAPDPISTATSIFSVVGFTATYTDHSSGGSGNLSVKVSWGDGKTSIITPVTPHTITHNYNRARTYNAKATIFDMGVNGTQRKMIGGITTPLTVAPLSISGLVTTSTGTPLKGVVVTLQQVMGTKNIARKRAITNASGVYTLTNVLPNVVTGPTTSTTDYTVSARKTGYTFPATAPFPVTNASITGKDVTANP